MEGLVRAVLAARTPAPVSVAKGILNTIIYILSAEGAATVCYVEPTRTILPICSDRIAEYNAAISGLHMNQALVWRASEANGA